MEKKFQKKKLRIEEDLKRKDADRCVHATQSDLSRKSKALQMVNEELRQYAFISNHELKAPLRAIRNYSDFLCEDLEGILNEEHRKCLDGLERAVRQGEELIDDLIAFSRVGMWNLSFEPIDIGKFLKELIASYHTPDHTEIVLGNGWPTVYGEPTLLTQIFEELIRNAIKFNHAPIKRISIGWKPAGKDDYELFVRDNGIGIESRHQEQIFHMFHRLHSRLDYPGTGIGLAIVRKAAFKLQGTVRVESTPEQGSTFFIVLPNTP
jgi:light-regulated signal transduction histidine kinase (bacteriophytochrome)